jgi:hypothetical protein
VFAANLVKELKTGDGAPQGAASGSELQGPMADGAVGAGRAGFITNPTDEKLLGSSDWQSATAEAMVRAVSDYFAARVSPSRLARRLWHKRHADPFRVARRYPPHNLQKLPMTGRRAG